MSAHSVSKPSWEIVSPLEFIKGYIACAICGHRELFRASCPQEILDRISKHVLRHLVRPQPAIEKPHREAA